MREITLDLPTVPDNAVVLAAVVVFAVRVSGESPTPEGMTRVMLEAKLVHVGAPTPELDQAIRRAMLRAVEQLTT